MEDFYYNTREGLIFVCFPITGLIYLISCIFGEDKSFGEFWNLSL